METGIWFEGERVTSRVWNWGNSGFMSKGTAPVSLSSQSLSAAAAQQDSSNTPLIAAVSATAGFLVTMFALKRFAKTKAAENDNFMRA